MEDPPPPAPEAPPRTTATPPNPCPPVGRKRLSQRRGGLCPGSRRSPAPPSPHALPPAAAAQGSGPLSAPLAGPLERGLDLSVLVSVVLQERDVSFFLLSLRIGWRSLVAGFASPTAVDTQPTEVAAERTPVG